MRDFTERIVIDPKCRDYEQRMLSELSNSKQPLVLWGCGEVGKIVFLYLERHGIDIAGVFIDDVPPLSLTHNTPPLGEEKKFLCGKKVHDLEGICNKFDEFNIIIGHLAGLKTASALKTRCGNIRNIYTLSLSLAYFGDSGKIDEEYFSQNKDDFEWVYDNLEDSLSKEGYVAYLNTRLNQPQNFIPDYDETTPYFCKDLMKPIKGEVFVDCGTFDGDTVRDFVNYHNSSWTNEWGGIHALEPDLANFSKLFELSKSIPRMYCVNKGAWCKPDVLKFSVLGNGSGRVESGPATDEDKLAIEVDSIDNLLAGKPADFIKMDIEGSEFNALKGARETILKYQPKLAICVYHRKEDFLTIPQYVKSLFPDYCLYFRLHRPYDTEAVLYALPRTYRNTGK